VLSVFASLCHGLTHVPAFPIHSKPLADPGLYPPSFQSSGNEASLSDDSYKDLRINCPLLGLSPMAPESQLL
jgi:hypothetical protein